MDVTVKTMGKSLVIRTIPTAQYGRVVVWFKVLLSDNYPSMCNGSLGVADEVVNLRHKFPSSFFSIQNYF